jgi:hypothetical protein
MINKNMKRNNLLIGGLGIVAITASMLITNSFSTDDSSTAKYTKNRESLDKEQGANGFREWLKGMMIDVETGQEITPERLNEVMAIYQNSQSKAISVDWVEEGPDNIGGRTRAILIDYTSENFVWAGGVSGGLYLSPNGGNSWSRVENFPGNQYISSMAQDAGGNIYVATGSQDESPGWTGNGLFVTPDGGETWDIVPGTASENKINRVAATQHNSTVYFTTNTGLKSYTYGGTVQSVSAYAGNDASTLAYSADGVVLVVASTINQTFVSTDWGQTFTDKTGTGAGEIGQSYQRVEYAVSSKKSNGSYSIYAATSSGNNRGQWISLDSGETWYEHTPATGPNVTNGVIDYRDQGTYNSVVTFDPSDEERVIVGGIDLHEWKQQINNPPTGGWNKISLWFTNPTSDLYVHADNHELKWDSNEKLYIGNDGGIGISLDKAQTFYPANRGYNVTQFYHLGYDRNGSVIGGTQDNGCLYNDHTNTTYAEFKQVSGGDGFSAEISFFNKDVFFTSSQYNVFYRTSDAGATMNSFQPPITGIEAYGDDAPGGHPFNSHFFFAEHLDENSEDSISFVPQDNYGIGDTLRIPSLATGDTIDYITATNLYFDDTLLYNPTLTEVEYIVSDTISGANYDLGVYPFNYFPSASGNYPPAINDTLEVFVPNGPDTIVVGTAFPYNNYFGNNVGAGDTLNMGKDSLLLGVAWSQVRVSDPYQSWFIFSYQNGSSVDLYGTRDAARLSSSNPKWAHLMNIPGDAGNVDLEFSKDLNHVFVTGGNGIYRLDSLGSVYSTDVDFEAKVDIDEGATATTLTNLTSGSFQGLGVNPNNADDVVATQGFNGNVYRSSNATAASPSFSVVGSQGGTAYYDVIIDRDDNDILFAATFNGVALSENGGATWTDVTDPTAEGTPAYEVKQAWRTWEEGNKRPGAIYLASFGRGIWSSDAVLNVESEDGSDIVEVEGGIALEVYPNPSRYNSTLVVELEENNNMEIQFFNISGRLVKRIEKTNAYIGRNEVVFSAEDLPQGTYLIRVKSGKQMKTTKFMKM